jgi:hypothetical protein
MKLTSHLHLMLRLTLSCVIIFQAVIQTAVKYSPKIYNYFFLFLFCKSFFRYLQQLYFQHMTEILTGICCVKRKIMKYIKKCRKTVLITDA